MKDKHESNLESIRKQVKAIRKKLRDIQDLEDKRRLNPTAKFVQEQLDKIATKSELEDRLCILGSQEKDLIDRFPVAPNELPVELMETMKTMTLPTYQFIYEPKQVHLTPANGNASITALQISSQNMSSYLTESKPNSFHSPAPKSTPKTSSNLTPNVSRTNMGKSSTSGKAVSKNGEIKQSKSDSKNNHKLGYIQPSTNISDEEQWKPVLPVKKTPKR
jgi:hypothetical protein